MSVCVRVCTYICVGSRIKALVIIHPEEVVRDAGFHGCRTIWAESEKEARSVNISGILPVQGKEGRVCFQEEETLQVNLSCLNQTELLRRMQHEGGWLSSDNNR